MLRLFEKPTLLLRLEGLVLLCLAVAVYRHQSFGWGLFWSTLLLPDIALLGYLANARAGAIAYNITHSELLPGALALGSLAGGDALLLALSLTWFAHIGIDRLLGYGLKFPEGFKLTHLGVIGQAANTLFGRRLPCGR